jgi:XTP/dITP diphosphohydrolase
MDILFVTSNLHKLKEAQEILGDGFNLIIPSQMGIKEDIPEDGQTLEQNAVFKAGYVHKANGMDCFADDTGLEAEALGGAPGVYSARYAGPECNSLDNMHKLLKELEGQKNRKARFRCIVALILENRTYTFEGILNGTILEQQTGNGGFGYDPVFLPDGYTKTLAELAPEEKNLISHRGIAMRKLSEFLKKHYQK